MRINCLFSCSLYVTGLKRKLYTMYVLAREEDYCYIPVDAHRQFYYTGNLSAAFHCIRDVNIILHSESQCLPLTDKICATNRIPAVIRIAVANRIPFINRIFVVAVLFNVLFCLKSSRMPLRTMFLLNSRFSLFINL